MIRLFFSAVFLHFFHLWLAFGEDIENPYNHLQCRDPSYGGGHHKISEKKFLVISGVGGGIGNYLIFYPAAYYFAALTGRDILVLDASLIGEMCTVIHCGFPLYSEAATAFPIILPENAQGVRSVKAYDFGNHISRNALIEDRVVIASGYQYKSGWYGDNEFATQCIDKLTGCAPFDQSCQDRYALERLVIGPFHSKFRDESMKDFYHIAGIPANLRKGILSLPHAFAPRIDAAVHLRCQFSHFEWLVGPDDSQWKDYVKEMDDFLNSTAFNAGIKLFQTIEQKIVEQVSQIRKLRHQSNNRRRRQLLEYSQQRKLSEEDFEKSHSLLSSDHKHVTAEQKQSRVLGDDQKRKKDGKGGEEDIVSFHKLSFDEKVEKTQFHGDGEHDRIYVFLSSDNDRVKEAFANYLEDHDQIAVMRVKTDQLIQHAKHVTHLGQNASIGAFNLVMDWYTLSLANVLFAWRRDTGLLSTFAQSAACLSGNSEEIKIETKNGTKLINRNKLYGTERIQGFQLVTKNGISWNEF